MIKVQLSAEEMALVRNRDWILTKQRIIEKVTVLFGSLSTAMQLYTAQQVPGWLPEITRVPPKISKGEQYESMPYVVLDYPRCFSKEDVFAIRSFFWWGHYFSITLHLKGKFREQYGEKIIAAMAAKKLEGFYFSLTGNEFSFDLETKHHRLLHAATEHPVTTDGGSFLKISRAISFAQWNSAEQQLLEIFMQFASITAND